MKILTPILNRPDYTEVFLDSLYSVNHGIDIEPVIINNGSREKTNKIINSFIEKFNEKFGANKAVEIKLEKNFGYAIALNRALKKIDDPYVIIMHNDTIPFDGWAKELYECICNSDDDVALVMPRTNYANENSVCIQEVRSKFQNIKPNNKIRISKEEIIKLVDNSLKEASKEEFLETIKSIEPRFYYSHEISTFCCIVKNNLFKSHGYFDEDFFPKMYEDKLWFTKLERDGYVCNLSNRSFVFHFGNITSDGPGFSFPDVAKINREKFESKLKEINTNMYFGQSTKEPTKEPTIEKTIEKTIEEESNNTVCVNIINPNDTRDNYISYSTDIKDFSLRPQWILKMVDIISNTLNLNIIPNIDSYNWANNQREFVIKFNNKITIFDFDFKTKIRDLHIRNNNLVLKTNCIEETENIKYFPYLMFQTEKENIKPFKEKSDDLFFKGNLNSHSIRKEAFDLLNNKIKFIKKLDSNYMDDINNTKHCFSFRGIGEFCFRDIEILSVGSLLIKPIGDQVTHLVPNVNYIPLLGNITTWSDQIDKIIEMPYEEKEIIANNGKRIFDEYLSDNGFRKRLKNILYKEKIK